MTLVEWNDALTLGDEAIDRQHRSLVDIINEMHEHRTAPDRELQVMRCITSMYLYAREHFRDEESLMERIGYPERERHAGLHREFVARTNELTDCCLSDDAPYGELLSFLVGWFTDHLMQEDARMVAFAKARMG